MPQVRRGGDGADVYIVIRDPARFAAKGSHADVRFAAVEGFVVVEVPGFAEFVHAGAMARLRHSIFESASHLFPVVRRALTGLGVDGVPQHVLLAVVTGPEGFTGHGASLTSDALVEVHDHGDLTFAHEKAPSDYAARIRSIQSGEKDLMPARSPLPPSQAAKPILVWAPALSGAAPWPLPRARVMTVVCWLPV